MNKRNMIMVEQISIIKEDSVYMLYFETNEGSFSVEVDSAIAFKIQNLLDGGKSSFTANILVGSGVSVDRYSLFMKDKNLVSVLQANGVDFVGNLEELIPLALELDVKMFIDKNLVQNDYKFSVQHEEMVAEILDKESYYWASCHMEALSDAIAVAIKEERYEEAAMLRDQMYLLQSNTKQI